MKLADYSQVASSSQLDAALRTGSFDGVFHYVAGDNALRIEDPAVVTAVRQLGWPQLAIDVPTLGSVNGAATARIALYTYWYPLGSYVALDIEPVEFAASPDAWASAADNWCDAIAAAGLVPGVYGTDPTVAVCGSLAQWIWRARPGECDPAGPGLNPMFMAGRRAVQCGKDVFAGIEMDVSWSQFNVGGTMDEIEKEWLRRSALEVGSGPLADEGGGMLIPQPGPFPGGFADTTLGQLAAIRSRLETLAQPVVDVSALAAALGSDQAFLGALARAVALELGGAITKGA